MSSVRLLLLAVGIGGAFGGGLVFGDLRRQGALVSPLSEGALPLADQRTQRYEKVRERLKLRFHRDLKKERPRKARGRIGEGPRASKKGSAARRPAAAPAPHAAGGEAPSHAANHGNEASRTGEGPAEAQNQGENAGSDAEKEEEEEEEGLLALEDAAPDADILPPSGLVKSGGQASSPGDRRLREALRRVLGGGGPALPSQGPGARSSSSSAAGGKRYAVQVGSFPSMESAQKLVDKLRAAGERPAVVAAAVPGQGTVYRVRFRGPWSEAQAGAKRDALARAGIQGMVFRDD